MNTYDGLSLPELLPLMHDIVRPEPVSMWPETPGWSILLAWFALSALIPAWHGYRRWKADAYRREARRHLARIEKQASDPAFPAAREVATLLKRTALAAYPRSRVASLHGREWARFLRESSGDDGLVAATAGQLAAAAYRPDIDAAGLIAPAARWIEVHRA